MNIFSRLFQPKPKQAPQVKKAEKQLNLLWHDEMNFHSPAFDLPIDTIYYLESRWNSEQNDYVRHHLQDIEAAIAQGGNADGFFPYKLVYAGRTSSDVIPLMRQFCPEWSDLSTDEVIEDRTPVEKDCHKVSFIVRTVPVYGAEVYSYLFIDTEKLSIDQIIPSVNLLVYNIRQRNLDCLRQPQHFHYKHSSDYVYEDEIFDPDQPEKWDWYNPASQASSELRFRITRDSLEDGIVDVFTPSVSEAAEEIPEKPKKQERKPTPEEVARFRERARRFAEDNEEYRLFVEDRYNPDDDYEPEPGVCCSCPVPGFRLPEDRPTKKWQHDIDEEEELRAAMRTIRDRINALQQETGVTIWTERMAQDIIQQLRERHPLREPQLTIDERYRILLPQYNMEIKMTTLPKALYILWLRHPEGIHRKDLEDHKAELRRIYLTLSNRTDLDKLDASIAQLVVPGSESLNQKISVINAAFCTALAADLAAPYLITGPRGEAKRVSIASQASLPTSL